MTKKILEILFVLTVNDLFALSMIELISKIVLKNFSNGTLMNVMGPVRENYAIGVSTDEENSLYAYSFEPSPLDRYLSIHSDVFEGASRSW